MTTTTAPTTAPVTATTLDPRVELTLATQERSHTHWVEGEYPDDARPEAMFAAFAEAGWTLDPIVENIPAYEPFDYDDTRPSRSKMVARGYMTREFSLSKPGTGLFSDWTEAEKTANVREARAILRRFGFARVPVWTKTWQDLL